MPRSNPRLSLRHVLLASTLVIACAGDDGATSGATIATAATSEATTETTTATTDPSAGTTTADPSTTTDATTRTSTAGPTATDTTDTTDPHESDSESDSEGVVGWRSELYPEDWTPAHTGDEGRFLHDFSYAGYRGGGVEFAQDLPVATIDLVADHGADPQGESDASPALQAAIDAAADLGGAIITVPPGLYRLDSQVTVSSSRIVLRGAGPEASRLWMTASAGMSHKSHLTFRGNLSFGGDQLLSDDADRRSLTVVVADAGDLKVGDDIVLGWRITGESVDEHGMTGVWQAFNGAWQPFFWRTIVAIDPLGDGAQITLDVPLRYPALLRDQASLRRVDGALREVGVEDLGFADAVAWEQAWEENQVHVLELDGVVDAWVRGIASYPSPGAPTEGFGVDRHLQSGGLMIRRSKRVTVADSSLAWPENRGGGGNGYLFEVRQSSEILFRDLIGEAGRHNFIQNWGFGATGIVWLRIHSKGGLAVAIKGTDLGLVGLSEFHHSLATANLIDASVLDDGWGAVNRGDWSSGAGHAASESVLWNSSGSGVIRSRQFGHGYIIGASPTLSLTTSLGSPDAEATAPEDWVEVAEGAIDPPSLYEDQLSRRLEGG